MVKSKLIGNKYILEFYERCVFLSVLPYETETVTIEIFKIKKEK